MRILKWCLAAVGILVVAFIAIGMLLPREILVQRSAQISAPPNQIFPHLNNLQATQGWSPWLSIDPEVEVSFGEITEGVGARMQWASDNEQVGAGSMEIIESVADERVVSALDFGEMGTATASHDLVATQSGTKITWGLSVDMGPGPIGRWMGLMMDGWVGPDYERGLANLKALVEGG